MPKIYTGNRGGKYIIKNGKKRYIKNNLKNNFGIVSDYKFTPRQKQYLETIYEYMYYLVVIFYGKYKIKNNIQIYKTNIELRHSIYYSIIKIGESAKNLNKELNISGFKNGINQILPGPKWVPKHNKDKDNYYFYRNSLAHVTSDRDSRIYLFNFIKNNISPDLHTISQFLLKGYPVVNNNISQELLVWFFRQYNI